MLKSSHASAEDLKILYSMLNPKYIIPIIGEYRHLNRHEQLLKSFGYKDHRIVKIDNGVVSVINDGVLGEQETIVTGDEYVDGSLIGNVGLELISERERLAGEGIVVIVGYIDQRRRQMVGTPIITTKGFVYSTSIENFNDTISDFFLRMMKNALNRPTFDKEQIIKGLSEEIGKIVFRISKKRPAILPVLVNIKR